MNQDKDAVDRALEEIEVQINLLSKFGVYATRNIESREEIDRAANRVTNYAFMDRDYVITDVLHKNVYVGDDNKFSHSQIAGECSIFVYDTDEYSVQIVLNRAWLSEESIKQLLLLGYELDSAYSCYLIYKETLKRIFFLENTKRIY